MIDHTQYTADDVAPLLAQWDAQPIEQAPHDAPLRLLVDYSAARGDGHDVGEDAPIEDTARYGWTLGFYNDGLGEWQLAGWDWEQDYFREGRGKPVGFLPFLPGSVKGTQGGEGD